MTCLPYADQKPGAEIDLFCPNYAGGSSAVFRGWDAAFPDQISVRALELPGRGARMGQPLHHQPEPLVQQLTGELLPHIHRPFGVFGHSLGAALGFRIVQELQMRPDLPPLLGFFPAGRHSPTRQDPAKRRGHLEDTALIEAVRELGGSPPEVLDNAELMALILPVIRADFLLSEAVAVEHDPRPLMCDLHVFGSTDDIEVPLEALPGWKQVAGRECRITQLPGDHFFLHHAPQVARMRQEICATLDRALSAATSPQP